mgnify:CR=1 FL=1
MAKYDVRKRHEHEPFAKAWTGADPSWQWGVFEHREPVAEKSSLFAPINVIPRGLFEREEDARGFALLLKLNETMTEIRDANTLRVIQQQDERSEREAKVRQIIADQLEVALDDVTDDKRIMDDLDADSLAVVELVLEFEEHFAIEIADDVMETIPTVGKIIAYIEEQKGTDQ